MGDKIFINFVFINGVDIVSYWFKYEDVGRCFKVECSILLGEK